MSDQTVTLRITSDARGLVAGVEVVKRELGGLGGAGETAGRRTTAAMQSVSPAIEGIRRSVTQLVGAYAGLQSVRALVTMADQYSNISARLRIVTNGQAQFAAALDQTYAIAQRTYTGLESTATLYGRMQQATESLGRSQADALRVTELINQTFQISGTNAATASASIIQLAQGLSAGALRGDEFNSVLEGAPRLADALSASLGVTRGQLREMAEEGELTAEVIINALLSQREQIEAEFSQLPLTVGRAWQQLQTAALRTVGEVDAAIGGSGTLARGLQALTELIERVPAALSVWEEEFARIQGVGDGFFASFLGNLDLIGINTGDVMGRIANEFLILPVSARTALTIVIGEFDQLLIRAGALLKTLWEEAKLVWLGIEQAAAGMADSIAIDFGDMVDSVSGSLAALAEDAAALADQAGASQLGAAIRALANDLRASATAGAQARAAAEANTAAYNEQRQAIQANIAVIQETAERQVEASQSAINAALEERDTALERITAQRELAEASTETGRAVAQANQAAGDSAREAAGDVRELRRAHAEMAREAERASADMARMFDDLAAQMGGPSVSAALAYRDAMLRVYEIETALMALGPTSASQMAQLAALRQGLADQYVASQEDANRRVRESYSETDGYILGGIDAMSRAIGDFATRQIKTWRDLFGAMKDIALRVLSDIIAAYMRQRIMVSLNVGGTGGGLPGMPGLGGGTGGLQLPGLGNLAGGITQGGGILGGLLNSTFGAVGGALAGFGGALGSFGAGLTIAGNAGVLAAGQFGMAQLAAGNLAVGLGSLVPVIAAIAGVVKLIDAATGGKLLGTSYRPETATTTLSLGDDGGSASASVREVRQRSLFRGRQWRNRSVDAGDEAVQAADQLFDAVRQVMVSAARAMESEAPAMIEAALRTVTEYDSKGKVKATRYFVDALGRTWEEASAEAAATRISAEALIATIDAALGTTVQAASEAAGGAIGGVIDGMADKVDDAAGRISPPFDALVKSIGAAAGEASAIAERWRDDATVLMDGAQLMLAAATDIRRGAGLLGDGSLTSVVDLIEDMAAEGESLAAAYARVSAATGLLQQALDLSGVALDRTREEFVRFAADIAEAAGGIERAGQLWSSYFQTFYTETERLALAVSRAQSGAVREFSDIGLNADDFMGDGGGQRFRDMFEQVLPTLSAEAVVQWLEAANALGIWIDASAALARASGDAAEAVTGVTQTLDELMADVTAQLADYAPPQTFAERLTAITANTDSLIERAVALGATEEQLAQIRALGAAQMQEVLDEQSAAMGRYQDIVRGLSDELADARGLTDFQREMIGINRWLSETTSSMNEAARAAGLQGAAEADLAMAHELAAIRAAAAIARLEERGRGVVERLYGTPLEQLNQQIALLEQGMQGFASAATGGMEQVTQATDNAAQAQIGAQQRIREWLDNLMLGPLGGLRPRDALAEAQTQFQSLLARARGGDAEAMAALPQLADQLLRLGQQVYASGQPYFDLRDQIRAALTEIAAMPVAEPGGGIVPGGGGGGGGGSVGGGGAVGGDLQALYEERERLLAQQAAAERRELALELAGIIRDLTVATGQPLSEIEATLGFAMRDLVADLGVNLSDMTVATASQLADIAQTMGVELTDLAASVGVELGALADRQSLLNDALEAEITGLPQRERDLLEPLLRNVEDAAALGDTAGVEAGIGEMERAIQDMAPELRDALAPYFLAIRPADPTTELQHIASIDGGIASAVAELGMQTMSLGDIAYTLTAIEAALVGGSSASVPSYDVGTAFVPRDGLAMVHRGETILPAPVAAFFRRVGIPMPVQVPAAKAAAARDDRVIAGAIRDGNAAVVTELRALTGRVERLESATRDASERQTRALDRQTDALRTR